MSRLAAEIDIAVSAVYRYFPSKGMLIAEIQREALVRLTQSLQVLSTRADEVFAQRRLDPSTATSARLVLFGRWFCDASVSFPEEIRLLHQIMSHRKTVLDPEGGERMIPVAMELLLSAVSALDDGVASGALEPGSSIDRAAIWAAALGGVLETDDLSRYLPDVFGDARLARQTSLDLLRAWGISADLLKRSTELIDSLEADGSLAS